MENEDYKKSNREKRMTPKQDGYFWCYKCDREVVANYQKCPLCGHRNGTKTLKKDTDA